MSRFGLGFVGGPEPTSAWNTTAILGTPTFSNQNKNITATGTVAARGMLSQSNGKLYFEYVLVSAIGITALGIATSSYNGGDWPGASTHKGASYSKGGTIYRSNGTTGTSASGTAYTTGDTVSVAVDLTSGLAYFAKNGVWQASGNPSAGTGGQSYGTPTAMFPSVYIYASTEVRLNTGGDPFGYSLPTGYSKWG